MTAFYDTFSLYALETTLSGGETVSSYWAIGADTVFTGPELHIEEPGQSNVEWFIEEIGRLLRLREDERPMNPRLLAADSTLAECRLMLKNKLRYVWTGH